MVLALGFDTRFARSRPPDLQVPFSIRFGTKGQWNMLECLIFYYQIVVEYYRKDWRLMVRIHQRVHERHPELDDGDVEAAWESYCFAAVRIPGECEMRTGYDLQGRYIEMVGVLLADGAWLVYHAMTPPSKKTLREIENARRRGY